MCTGTDYRVAEVVISSERTRSSTARAIDPELAANHGINSWADFWQRALGLSLLSICNTVTFLHSTSSTSHEALILIVYVAFAFTGLSISSLTKARFYMRAVVRTPGATGTLVSTQTCTRPPETMSEIFSKYVVSPSVEVGMGVKSRVCEKA